MPTHLCQYIKTCPVYQGDKETNGTPLTLYKNVFCHRGIKGWNNCSQYIDYKKTSISIEE